MQPGEAMESQSTFLRAILATVARQTFSPAKILEIMGSNASEKHFRAFNLCDGSRSQAEIAKELGLDSGNFSKTLNRWIDEGIVIRVGEKREARPLHVYPLPEALTKKEAKK
jgi:DNA-binding MarR family transcriptional regulator